MNKKIIIIGGGASGLMAAATLAKKLNNNSITNVVITVIEQMNKLGAKLLATGGGRCNVTNVLGPNEFMKTFGKHGRFMSDAIKEFDNNDVVQWFADNRVPLECSDEFHYFPQSKRSSEIVSALFCKCDSLGVELLTDCKVIDCQENTGDEKKSNFSLLTSDHFRIDADIVVFCCGGASYSQLGGSLSGYRILEKLNHNIVKPLPGMVGLKIKENWIKKSTGISFDNVEVTIDLKKYRKQISKGELLLTHEGLSANAVINISATISELLEQFDSVPITVKLFPNKTTAQITQEWQELLQKNTTKNIGTVLAMFLPKSLANNFLSSLSEKDIAVIKVAELPKKINLAIIKLLTECQLNVVGTGGFDKAMVTRGGVDLKNINPKTLESKIITNLYFAGEFVNLDGPCGGFNLQWAFSSGHFVAKNIFNKICEELEE